MVPSLNSENILQYLVEQRLRAVDAAPPDCVESMSFKNFNLHVSFPDQQLLVKQERSIDKIGRGGIHLWKEWRLQELMLAFPELSTLQPLVSEVMHFHTDQSTQSTLVLQYFQDFQSLAIVYDQQQFAEVIAVALGKVLAQIHQATLNGWQYKTFLVEKCSADAIDLAPNFRMLTRIAPEMFGLFCMDGIEFFKYYQRYPQIEQALLALEQAWQPCCLVHRDLQFGNVLVQVAGQPSENLTGEKVQPSLRIIDWEMFAWGDPALDVGTVIASYLRLWLGSVVFNRSVDIQTALQQAGTPLISLQPSLIAFCQSYCCYSPTLVAQRPDFLEKAIKLAGFFLVDLVLAKIEDHEPFGNAEVCLLQVAKQLLCQPVQAAPTIFGVSLDDLSSRSRLPQEPEPIPSV
jgi:hypothetical protein